jgi:hypothetical protein
MKKFKFRKCYACLNIIFHKYFIIYTFTLRVQHAHKSNHMNLYACCEKKKRSGYCSHHQL